MAHTQQQVYGRVMCACVCVCGGFFWGVLGSTRERAAAAAAGASVLFGCGCCWVGEGCAFVRYYDTTMGMTDGNTINRHSSRGRQRGAQRGACPSNPPATTTPTTGTFTHAVAFVRLKSSTYGRVGPNGGQKKRACENVKCSPIHTTPKQNTPNRIPTDGHPGSGRLHHPPSSHHTPPTGSGLRYGSMPTHLPSTTAAAGGFSLSAAASSPLGTCVLRVALFWRWGVVGVCVCIWWGWWWFVGSFWGAVSLDRGGPVPPTHNTN